MQRACHWGIIEIIPTPTIPPCISASSNMTNGVGRPMPKQKRKLSTRSSNCSGTNTTAYTQLPKENIRQGATQVEEAGDKEQQLAIDTSRYIISTRRTSIFSSMPAVIYRTKLFPERIHLLMMNTENRVSPPSTRNRGSDPRRLPDRTGSHAAGSRQATPRNVLRATPPDNLRRHAGDVSKRVPKSTSSP